MTSMQWALLIGGLVIVALVYWMSRRELAGEEDVAEPDQVPLWDQLDLDGRGTRIDGEPAGDADAKKTPKTDKRTDGQSAERSSAPSGSPKPTAAPESTVDTAKTPAPDSPAFDEFGVGKPRVRGTGSTPPLAAAPAGHRLGAEQHAADGAGDLGGDNQAEGKTRAPSVLLVLYLVEKQRQMIAGTAIHDALRAEKLTFGHHEIYHRIKEVRGVPEGVFSVASIAKPGFLDPMQADELQTPGLAMFLPLPGVEKASDAFEDFVKTASRLAQRLNAAVLDESKQPLGEESLNAMREQALKTAA